MRADARQAKVAEEPVGEQSGGGDAHPSPPARKLEHRKMSHARNSIPTEFNSGCITNREFW